MIEILPETPSQDADAIEALYDRTFGPGHFAKTAERLREGNASLPDITRVAVEDGRLIGVGIVDVFKEGLSSAYFYHDPAWRKQSPGTFSILTEIEWGKANSLKYSYLGYWIHENQSMNYKARFDPHQLLEACVDLDEAPNWKRSSG